MQNGQFDDYEPKVVLAVGAHPDDIDFGASGSLARWAKAGARVEYLIITDGSKGTDDRSLTGSQLTEVRQAEQRNAAATLGAQNVTFLNYEDGALEVTLALKKDIVRIIRTVRPDTVIVMDPSMVYSSAYGFINHPDHRAAGQATLDAVYPLARDHLSFPELLDQAHLEPHKVAHVLLMNFDAQNFFVDITETLEFKLLALSQHVSQLPNQSATFAMIRERAASTGALAGVKFAESFIRLDLPV